MAQELTTTDQRPARVVRYQKSLGSLSLPSALEALDSTESVLDFPLLTAAQMELAKQTVDDLLASLEPAGPDHVRKIVASLAYLPHREKSEEETEMMVRDFVSALQGVPRDVLDKAREKVVAKARFFPTPAEMLAHCGEHNRRAWLLSRVRMAIRRGVAPPPVKRVTQIEMDRIKQEIAEERAKREGVGG